ncbi:MAG: hypothetical protein M1816_006761 [Peltula sp. TS41687]|nr:MAG: hypothetical protein M1816_006761 [Peltula sp. TS41687]
MKTFGLSLTVLTVLQLVAAQPHGKCTRSHGENPSLMNHREGHHHLRRHPNRKVVTETKVVTKPAVNVVVIVDQQGNPIATTTEGLPAPTDVPAANSESLPPAAPAPTSTPVELPPADQYAAPAAAESTTPVSRFVPQSTTPLSEYAPAPTTTEAAYQAPAPVSEQSAAPSTSPSSAPEPPTSAPAAAGHGLTYTPYNADGTCKSKDQVDEDFKKISGFSMIRMYGTDCNQLQTVIPAAQAKGMKVFAGISNNNVLGGKVQQDVEALASACGDKWDVIDTIAVGNELVQSGNSPGVAVAAVNSAREALRAKGYNGPVVSVDTVGAMTNHPEICQNSDYVAANIHAFFDGKIEASGAGPFVNELAKQVAGACGGKKVVVTETGWPNGGSTNNKAVPGPEQQQAALASIREQYSSNPAGVIFFSAFNDLWKVDNPTTFGCEKHWGILG